MSIDGPADALPAGDLRPIVRTSAAGNRTVWVFAVLLAVVAALLFEALSARREQLSAPATQAVPANGAVVTAPPPLVLPPQFQTAPAPAYPLAPAPLAPARPVAVAPAAVPRAPLRPAPQAPLPIPQYVPPPAVIQDFWTGTYSALD